MKQYLFTVALLLLLLIAASGVHASIHEIRFINHGYTLDKKYLPQLLTFTRKHNISLETLQNWIMAESSGNERAYNKYSHDYGLCQLHNVKYLVRKYWYMSGHAKPFNVYDGEHNLFIALAYLSDLIDSFGVRYGFMAYNIGYGRISKGDILQCGIDYVNRILPEESEIKYYLIIWNPHIIMRFREQELYDKRGIRV